MTSPAPAVVLVRPSEQGNIGAAARAMANTGLTELVLVEPAAPIGATARTFAVGAGSILDGARTALTLAQALAPYQRLVATSSQRQRTAKSRLLSPRELGRLLLRERAAKTALVFGPESSGLTTEELARCPLVVRIPAAPRQPTLNLAQAVLIVGYELFVAGLESKTKRDSGRSTAVPAGEVDALLDHLRSILGLIGFARDDTFPSVFRDLRRLAARTELTSREIRILRGIFRRAEHRLASLPPKHE